MKKIILNTSVIGSVVLLFFRYPIVIGWCAADDYSCRKISDNIEQILYFFPIILIIVLAIYKLSDTVFVYWWKFARWAIPSIFLLSLVINLELHHNPTGQWQDMFDLLALLLMYAIFIIGSIVQIYRGYRNK